MDDNTAKLVERYADKLVGLAGDTAPEAWDILLRGQAVHGFVNLMWAAFFGVVAFAAYKGARRMATHDSSYQEVAWGAGAVVCFFCIVCALGALGDGVSRLCTPEVFALQELMQ